MLRLDYLISVLWMSVALIQTALGGHVTESVVCGAPSGCTCQGSNGVITMVSCIGLGLGAFPNLPKTVIRIDLSNNDITNISKSDIGVYSSLTDINLSKNYLNFLGDDVFVDAGNLKKLNLSENPLFLRNCSVFSPLKKLEVLSLKYIDTDQNCIKQIGSSSPSLHFFAGRVLNIRVVMSYLRNLRTLDVESSYLQTLSVNDFTTNNSLILERLSLRETGLKTIMPNTFSKLKNLTFLDLSCNEDLTFKGAMKGLEGINETSIRSLILDSVNMRDSIKYTLPATRRDFASLKGTRIKHLSIRYNKIVPYAGTVLFYLPDLEYINLDGNYIGVYKEIFSVCINLFRLVHLREIHVSWQYTGNYGCERYSIYPIDSAFTEYTQDEEEGDQFVGLQMAGVYYYVFNKIPVPQNLEKIYIVHTLLLYFWNIDVEFAPNNVKLVDLSENRMESIETTVRGLTLLSHLILRNNNLKYVKPGFLAYLPSIKIIELQDNLLGLDMKPHQFARVFENVTSLTEIDLTSNYLHNLTAECLTGNKNLTKLHLANNKLAKIGLQVENFPMLEFLNLSKNAILFLSLNETSALDSIAKQHELIVDLSGNIMLCSCATLNFLEWLRTASVTFPKKSSYMCTYKGKTRNLEEFLNSDYEDFRDECFSNVITVLTSSLVAGTVLVLSVVIGWYRRWHIRYIIYKLFRQPPEPNDGHRYDAYLAYESRDHDKALEMTVVLERDHGLKIYIHDRNAPLPGDHHDSIFDGVGRSKKVILLITDHALRSQESWWSFETDLSLSIKGKGKILCVVKGHLPIGRLNRKLRYLMADDTYLLWPDNENAANMFTFWRNVALAITSKNGIQIDTGVCGLYVPEHQVQTIAQQLPMERISAAST